MTEKIEQPERKIPSRPRISAEKNPRRRHLGIRSKLAIGAVGVTAALLAGKQIGISIPGVPKVHEELHAMPPEIGDDVVVTKLGAIGAFSKSVQTYKSTAHLRLLNEDNEERETLGYSGSHRVVRTQEGKPSVTHDDSGNKTVALPSTLGVIARGEFKILYDDSTGRDGGQAVVGWLANSQTPRELGQTMYTDTIEAVAGNDVISNRQTLCVGIAATAQFLSDLKMPGYFVPTWHASEEPVAQPADTRTISVVSEYDGQQLTVESCNSDLVSIGFDPELAGNMHAGAKASDAEVQAGMLLPERRLKDQILKAGMDQYLEDSKE